MIGHGTSRFLKERLFDCSDPYQIIVCNKCGMITSSQEECTSCLQDKVTTCNMPYATKLLIQELMAMGIKVAIKPKYIIQRILINLCITYKKMIKSIPGFIGYTAWYHIWEEKTTSRIYQ